jgi:hypothetical protein
MGLLERFDLSVWAEVAGQPADVHALAGEYADAGATWWIETARPHAGWWEQIQKRMTTGV